MCLLSQCYEDLLLKHLTPHQHERYDKRQAESSLQDSTTYRKIVTTQKDGEKPIESNYFWSSSSGEKPPPDMPKLTEPSDSTASSEQIIKETIRRISTQTLSAEDNQIDKRPIDGPNTKLTSLGSSPDQSPSTIGDDHDSTISNTQKISYNISIIRDLIKKPLSPGLISVKSCPQNHFGNEVIGCKMCQCNNNIDITDTDNCDSLTGRCLKCLYNTEGDHCEKCKTGFAGDATKQQCRECVCHSLGTDPRYIKECHHLTGQCSCLPHVEGTDCGKCKVGYFNISSGHGCQACGCDSIGSVSPKCGEIDGKCECISGYSGLKCDECPLGQYGDPRNRCLSCNCNRDGSVNQYCDSKTGQCKCLTGIGGEKCDHCARGYHGRFPTCESCGECWDYWNKLISALKDQTQGLLDRVRLLLKIGTTGANTEEFNEIESKLNRIKDILDGQKLNEADIRDLAKQVDELAKRLKELEKTLANYEREADDISNRTMIVQNALRDYDKIIERPTLLIEGLLENATLLQEANVDGAHKIILDSQNRSREAEKMVKDLKPLMLEQEQLRRTTDYMFASTTSRFNSTSLQNEAILAALARQIYELEQGVPGINQLVCASTSTVDKCDQLCGGALCNKCGGLSCSEGATTKASNALELAQQAWDLLNQKYNQSKLDYDAIMEARNLSEEALKQAKAVLADCELQKSKFDKVGNELNSIMDGVDKFYMMDGARPAEVRTLGNECLALSISLKPEQILDLARQINVTISSLTNIDKILQDTAGDLHTAEQLHQQADRAKEAADNILETVEQVLNMLRLAAIEQAKAAAAIAAATADIEGAQSDLAEISADTESLSRLVSELTKIIKDLQDRLNELRKKYAQNEMYIAQARAAAEEANKLADQAEKDADELADKVRLAEEKLRNKALQNGEMKDRAERLKNDALQMAGEILMRMKLLQELDDLFDEYVKRLKDYQDIVDDLNKQMNQYLKDIDMKAQFYRECQT